MDRVYIVDLENFSYTIDRFLQENYPSDQNFDVLNFIITATQEMGEYVRSNDRDVHKPRPIKVTSIYRGGLPR